MTTLCFCCACCAPQVTTTRQFFDQSSEVHYWGEAHSTSAKIPQKEGLVQKRLAQPSFCPCTQCLTSLQVQFSSQVIQQRVPTNAILSQYTIFRRKPETLSLTSKAKHPSLSEKIENADNFCRKTRFTNCDTRCGNANCKRNKFYETTSRRWGSQCNSGETHPRSVLFATLILATVQTCIACPK